MLLAYGESGARTRRRREIAEVGKPISGTGFLPVLQSGASPAIKSAAGGTDSGAAYCRMRSVSTRPLSCTQAQRHHHPKPSLTVARLDRLPTPGPAVRLFVIDLATELGRAPDSSKNDPPTLNISLTICSLRNRQK